MSDNHTAFSSSAPARKRSRSHPDTDDRLLELSSAVPSESPADAEKRLIRLSSAFREVLACIGGEDPTREGLLDTPRRAAEAFGFWTKGYRENLVDIVNGAVFEENHEEMVIVQDIGVFSTCEHHLAPFHGKCHIGYVPNGKVLGLSKFARVVEMFARRLQVQERLTTQICEAIMEILQPKGVAVIIECAHFCMTSRGVQKSGSMTKTSSVRGVFKSDARTRQEFFSHVYSGRGNAM